MEQLGERSSDVHWDRSSPTGHLRPRLSPCANRWHLDEFLSSPFLEPLPKLTRTQCFSLGPQLSQSESLGSLAPCQLGALAKYQCWVQFACSSAFLASPDGLASLSPPKHVTLATVALACSLQLSPPLKSCRRDLSCSPVFLRGLSWARGNIASWVANGRDKMKQKIWHDSWDWR